MEKQAKEYWQVLCEQALREKNADQLIKLVEELNNVLDQRSGHRGQKKSA